MKNILIIGANSAIAEHYARLESTRGSRMALVGRSDRKLDSLRQDLTVRGCGACIEILMDVNDFDSHGTTFESAVGFLGQIDVILIAHGDLPQHETCIADPRLLRKALDTNGVSTILLMNQSAALLEQQGHGTLVVISSVAGDRGRASNYVYGSAKAAVTSFASGLRQSLSGKGINVLTVKPGFVDTPMTAGFKKGILWAKPERIAKGIQRGIARGQSVAYLPGFWRLIMTVINLIPEFIFRRIRL